MNGLVRSGRDGASALWTGSGINSSSAAAVASGNTRPATALAAVANDRGDGTPLLASLFGQALDTNTVIVKYGLEGDVNLDGRVDISDYFAVDVGRAMRRPGYGWGDLNYTGGAANADDYMLIDRTFLAQGSTQGGGGLLAAAPAAVRAPAPVPRLLPRMAEDRLFAEREENEGLEPLF